MLPVLRYSIRRPHPRHPLPYLRTRTALRRIRILIILSLPFNRDLSTLQCQTVKSPIMKIINTNCASVFYTTVLVVQILMLVLKLTTADGMPWLLVLLPLWATAAVIVIAIIASVIVIKNEFGEDER